MKRSTRLALAAGVSAVALAVAGVAVAAVPGAAAPAAPVNGGTRADDGHAAERQALARELSRVERRTRVLLAQLAVARKELAVAAGAADRAAPPPAGRVLTGTTSPSARPSAEPTQRYPESEPGEPASGEGSDDAGLGDD